MGVAVPGLFRSRSLPHLYTGDSGVGSFSDGPQGNTPAHKNAAPEIRQLLTLKQHYYPEGGWGWVVVSTALIVQVLTHGLHTASGVLLSEMINKFGTEVSMTAGMPTYHLILKKVYKQCYS